MLSPGKSNGRPSPDSGVFHFHPACVVSGEVAVEVAVAVAVTVALTVVEVFKCRGAEPKGPRGRHDIIRPRTARMENGRRKTHERHAVEIAEEAEEGEK